MWIAARFILVISLGLSFSPPQAQAFSLWGHPTDDYACDFSPMTTHGLAAKTHVPGSIAQNEQTEIYTRLALRQAVESCKNGQMLILHSEDGHELDSRYFRLVASHLCLAADIKQKPVPSRELPDAFELRCRIAKMTQARAFITEAEAAKSTEALILEAYRRSRTEAAGGAVAEPAEGSSLRMCPGQVIGVGGLCDR